MKYNRMYTPIIIIFLALGGLMALVTWASNGDPYPKTIGKEIKEKDYTQESIDSFNSLIPPVILIGKDETVLGFSITVIDSTKRVYFIGDMSGFACTIGASRAIGDRLK